jgi:uncharacterized protein YbjQ (UPF0145 family)
MIVSGFSGNEVYCLAQKGWSPGNIVVGNSVQSLGLVGGVASSLRTIGGGEIANLSQLIAEGRHAALARLEDEANEEGAQGVTGVTSELRQINGLQEFIAIGSTLLANDYRGPFFTTACSGQDLYCQIDAGYEPRHFVIGNVAYALGVGRGLMGMLRGFAGGEVKEFSDMYNHTRAQSTARLAQRAVFAHATALGRSTPAMERCDFAPKGRGV